MGGLLRGRGQLRRRLLIFVVVNAAAGAAATAPGTGLDVNAILSSWREEQAKGAQSVSPSGSICPSVAEEWWVTPPLILSCLPAAGLPVFQSDDTGMPHCSQSRSLRSVLMRPTVAVSNRAASRLAAAGSLELPWHHVEDMRTISRHTQAAAIMFEKVRWRRRPRGGSGSRPSTAIWFCN